MQIHRCDINFEQAMEFVAVSRRHLRRASILVPDRRNVHRNAVHLLLVKHPD
jgi:hypothetical protein